VSSVCTSVHHPSPDPLVSNWPQLKPTLGICLFTTTTFGAHHGADSGAGWVSIRTGPSSSTRGLDITLPRNIIVRHQPNLAGIYLAGIYSRDIWLRYLVGISGQDTWLGYLVGISGRDMTYLARISGRDTTYLAGISGRDIWLGYLARIRHTWLGYLTGIPSRDPTYLAGIRHT
jgi:hypothetical protein